MLENIVLGFIQGIFEWLPVSSEGLITLVNLTFLKSSLAQSVEIAIFLHLGTFLAALFYFRKDVLNILFLIFPIFSRSRTSGNSQKSDFWESESGVELEYKKILIFLIFSTIFTGVVGFLVLKTFLEIGFSVFGLKFTIVAIGGLLIITGLLQFKKPEEGFKNAMDLTIFDSILFGVVQGFAALPGLSRSGLTVATFLFRGYKDTEALRLSFLMSLPAVLGANILLLLGNFKGGFDFNSGMLFAVLISFVVGIATIHGLISLSRKINFGWFAILFGVLTLAGIMIL